ncbi:MAG: hypothetical protein IPK72_05200 [Candidatus Eisenbacteria bacterium]|nr:hypothetical protein [Candidatus Eisenbacteria bacterium]
MNPYLPGAVGFVVAALVSAVSVRFWRGRLSGDGWVDRPRPDRHSLRAVPRIGGPAWLSGMVVGLLILSLLEARGFGYAQAHVASASLLAVAMLLAFTLGRWEERGEFRAGFKWRLQLLLLLLTVLGLMLAQGSQADPINVPKLRLLVALGVATLLQLALNIADNLDGALGAASLFGLLGLALAGHGFIPAADAAWAGAGATLGFLCWNLPPARIFLGNGGSEMLSLLAAALLAVAWARPTAEPRWTLLLPFAWPLFDFVFVVLRRLREGRKPWQGGRDHTTHLLARRFGSDRPVTALLLLVAAIGLAVAFLSI